MPELLLSHILSDVDGFETTVVGRTDKSIDAIGWDYRNAAPGAVYVCLEDEEFHDAHIQTNALNHYRDALHYGATVFVVSEKAKIDLPNDTTLIRVYGDLNSYMAFLARTIYGDPFKDITIVTVTGTKGKTTTCQILESVYGHLGYKTGYIGTIGVFMPGKSHPPGLLSNPTATDLFAFGRQMKECGVQVLLMEITSQGMSFRRNVALPIHTAIFSNLGSDHLDFHRTRERYKKEKLKHFQSLGNNHCPAIAVINADEADCADVYNAIPPDRIESGLVKVVTYGIKNKESDFTAYPEEMTGGGSTFRTYYRHDFFGKISIPLPGLFNIYNALSAFTCVASAGENKERIISGILNTNAVKGRFEKVDNPKNIDIYIDYAHTSDSLKNILSSLMELNRGKLICVFGCGGDRDRGKRPSMGKIAAEMADEVWITSDNPRTEEPKKIIDEIVRGVADAHMHKIRVETDRATAISLALSAATPDDTVLITGKGHERYQIIGKKKIHFSDREEIKTFFAKKPAPVRQVRGMIHISETALKHNFRLIVRDMADSLSFMAVVKDNAVGIGMIDMANAALNFGAVYLACSNTDEAFKLRNHFQNAPILIFGERADDELAECVRQNISLQMQSVDTLRRLNEVALELNRKTKIHVKIDSGMNRYGLKPAQASTFYELADAMPFVEIEGLMTHFAMSDELDKTFAVRQLDVFNQALKTMRKTRPYPKYIHACNTGGYLDLPQAHFNMVRLGILPTGVYPSKVCRRIDVANETLKPVLSLTGRVAFVKSLHPGDTVGYGMRYTVEKPMTVAVIPIGYGDGYPRLRNTGGVLINGRFAPIVGGVSLDAVIVDITTIPNVKKDTGVTLIGKNGTEEITVVELADHAGTVAYHIMIQLNRRLARSVT